MVGLDGGVVPVYILSTERENTMSKSTKLASIVVKEGKMLEAWNLAKFGVWAAVSVKGGEISRPKVKAIANVALYRAGVEGLFEVEKKKFIEILKQYLCGVFHFQSVTKKSLLQS